MSNINSEQPENSSIPRNASLAFWAEGQVANRLGISVQWLRQERALGRSIPFYRFGRSIKYRIADVLAYEVAAAVKFTGENPSNGGRSDGQ